MEGDPPRECSRKVAQQLLIGRVSRVWILFDQFQQSFNTRPQAGLADSPGILLGLLREEESIAHHASLRELFFSGSFMPRTIDSLIPGMESR